MNIQGEYGRLLNTEAEGALQGLCDNPPLYFASWSLSSSSFPCCHLLPPIFPFFKCSLLHYSQTLDNTLDLNSSSTSHPIFLLRFTFILIENTMYTIILLPPSVCIVKILGEQFRPLIFFIIESL